MSTSLFVFNPDHDLALACFDRNFNPPQSARLLASDLSCLPLWYASPNASVLCVVSRPDWWEDMQRLFPVLVGKKLVERMDPSDSVVPWGWNPSFQKQMEGLGGRLVCPEPSEMEVIRRLSHRRQSLSAHDFIRSSVESVYLLAERATELKEEAEVVSFVAQHGQVILKSPWSGSGKGLLWLRHSISESQRGWCRQVLYKQGSLLAESIYANVQDFAMLFECRQGQVYFVGYSLFETERGIYRANWLWSDARIEEKLVDLGLPKCLLTAVSEALQEYLRFEFAPGYVGYLGVDMFVYHEDGRVKLHPCVEINLRMTMGLVARIFFDRYVDESKEGMFFVDRGTSDKDLWYDHRQREQDDPLVVDNGRIQSGYLSLTPIETGTQYRVRVEIR